MREKARVIVMTFRTKAVLVSRLRTIEGHVRGICRMVEAEASCLDVLAQTLAVQRAIDRFAVQMVGQHLHACVVTVVRGETRRDREGALRNLLEALQAAVELKVPRRLRAAASGQGLPSRRHARETWPARAADRGPVRRGSA